MKLKHIFYTAAAMAMLSFQACTLDEDTSGISNPDDFFRKFSECQSVVNGCYIPIKSIYTYTYMIATECVTDIAYCPSGTLDASLDISPAVPRMGSTVWRNGYLGVQRCNFAVNGIERAYKNEVISEEQYHQLLCEAKTLRAFFYWTLTCFFGNVPFYFDDVTDNEVLSRIQVLPRMDANETRNKVIEDLQSIAPLAAQTRTYDNEANRLGASCAYMLIAKMAMWNKQWDVALDALEQIETIYGPLSQYDYAENILFRNKNTPESIMEIQHTYTQGALTYTSNVACICQPYPRAANSAVYDGVEIPEMGTGMTTWTSMRPNSYFCDGLQTKKSNDKRKTLNMAWEYDGKPFSGVGTRPWLGPKFWCPGMQNTADFSNQKVFRYADAILMMAECYAETEDSDEAVRYLNMVRERAGTTAYVFKNKDALLEEIQKERGRELLGEFQRKFDLVRWGIWYQMTYEYTNYPTLKDNMLPCHEYYPIPDKEVVYSGGALDNKAYNEYGM
mgnify:FL=1